MNCKTPIIFAFLLLMEMHLAHGKNNNSMIRVWEKWGRPFGCRTGYLVMNYQNRNPVRKACLPRGYAENVAPHPDGITYVAVQYNHLRFLELKEEEKTFTVDVKMSYHWQGRRIIANDENSKELIVVVPDVEVPAIWKPSPKINDMKMITPALEPSLYTELMLYLDKNDYSNFLIVDEINKS